MKKRVSCFLLSMILICSLLTGCGGSRDTNDYVDVFFDHITFRVKLEQLKTNRRYVVFRISDDDLLVKEIKNINNGKNPARFSCEVEFNSVSGRVNKVYFWEK